MMRIPFLTALMTLILSFSFTVHARSDAPAVSAEGLELVADSKLALVYARPDTDFSRFTKYLLMEPHVAFRENWQRDINRQGVHRVTSADVLRIRTELANLFNEILVSSMTASGHEIVTELGENVLIIRPAILDLDVSSPESSRATTTRSLSRIAGEMTLLIELRDAVTGDLLAKGFDHQFDDSRVRAMISDSTRNEQAARRVLETWAGILVNGLDEISQTTQNVE
jgi:hypothetical protein